MRLDRKESQREDMPKSMAETQSPVRILVVVHPGSACGSADFNYNSRQTAEACRQRLIWEWRDWCGVVIVIDGALSDELPQYPQFNAALDELLTRARSGGFLAIRAPGDDPDQDRVITPVLRKWKLPKDGARFLVTGAWHYPGSGGCVGSVCNTIRALGYHATISPAALTGEVNSKEGRTMHWYKVTVFAVAEKGEETRLGTVKVKAASLADAQRLAMATLWDERLSAASCHARYENEPL